MNAANTKCVVAFGEVLWDCLPSGLFLGGAPLNVAYHAARLGAESYVASSVGKDLLGDEAFRRLEAAGIGTNLLKRHPRFPTGASVASLDDAGDATYDILEEVAWDEISLGEEDAEILVKADALVYGSLAARSRMNLDLLSGLLERTQALKVCDVNLRAPYDDPELALSLARRADVIKVNDDELEILSGLSGDDLQGQVRALGRLTGVGTICVTLGKRGALLWRDGKFLSESAAEVETADTIGAGDSFTAALCMGILHGYDLEECLRRAVRLSAFVASKNGAQPDYEAEEVLQPALQEGK